MSVSIGSIVLLADIVTCLKQKHPAIWARIKEEICASDAELEKAVAEMVSRKKRPELKTLRYTPFAEA